MNFYLVTIKSRGNPYTTKRELDIYYHRLINLFKNGDWSCFRCYEITAIGRRLHLHTIVGLPITTYYNKIMKSIKNNRMYFHLKKFPESDYNNVLSYITKQQQNKYELEQILVRNEYYHKYGFV